MIVNQYLRSDIYYSLSIKKETSFVKEVKENYLLEKIIPEFSSAKKIEKNIENFENK